MNRLFIFLLILLIPIQTYAETGGSGNVDTGGGDMGDGTSSSYWNPGMEGVRVTIVDEKKKQPVTTPIDLTNKNPSVTLHFGKSSKLYYYNYPLCVTSRDYLFYRPCVSMPRIISTNGNSNIDTIKSYFCDERVVKYIADYAGIPYTKLISGKYKLLLEPIAYFTYNDVEYAMTAHEAALYDNQVNGALRKAMTSLTHQNLPLSMFLEYPDLGFPAYKGATNKTCSNDTIIRYLGMGIVRFQEKLPDVDETNNHYTYRCNTEVITPVTLFTAREISPDSPAQVTFTIKKSRHVVKNIVIPEDESQLVWVKWKTPGTPQTITITVSTTKGVLSQKTIKATVIDLKEQTPPNPQATDTRNNWKASAVPSRSERQNASWSVWSAGWHEKWVWHENWVWDSTKWVDYGEWRDLGWYEFICNNYRAALSAKMNLAPDDKVPTAYRKSIKSGYGVKNTAFVQVNTAAPISHYTYGQTAVSYFPEFNYKTYSRILDQKQKGRTSQFQFKPNLYSTYNRRVHFTPLWIPNGKYTVNTYLIDVWTPAGMLSANLTDSVTIQGSVMDDWHIAPAQ